MSWPRPITAAACAVALWAAPLNGVTPAWRTVGQAPASAASARAWIDRQAEIEARLRSADVERLEDIGTGVTRPRRAYLRGGSGIDSLAWKVLPPGRRGGYWESYKSEIAAYELDKLLGMNVVPPAVERAINGETGAAVLWLESVKSVKESGGKVPSGPAWGRPIRVMLMFDDLIANIDRNAGNILIGAPGELILIDHSRAFVADAKLVNKLERVDAALWERIQSLTRDELARALGPWLDARQIDAILERRNAMAKAVDKLVAKKGRAAVIVS